MEIKKRKGELNTGKATTTKRKSRAKRRARGDTEKGTRDMLRREIQPERRKVRGR